MIASFLSRYYGVNRDELKKFLFLGAIFAFTIGIYWMLRPLKDSLFMTISCATNIPWAKIASLVVVVPLAIGYSMIVDRYPRHRIFYVLCGIYGVLALFFAYFFTHDVYGLHADNIIRFIENGKSLSIHKEYLSQIVGWMWYVYVESFGSLMVVLFWGFAADTTKPESAKRGFGLVAMGAQFGGIMGPWLAENYVESMGEGFLAACASVAIVLMGCMIFMFMKTTPKDQLEGYKAKDDGKSAGKEKTGFMEGLKLLVSQPYLLSIFGIISIFEIVNTIFDYKLKMLAQTIYQGQLLSRFLLNFGKWVNIIGFVCLVLGINNIGRKLGVRKSLLMLPALVAIAVFVIYFNSSLWVVWGVNAAVKALNYAFNQPVKEQLYIPTSKDTKYKAKAWTEMFGSRGSKAAGSTINMLLKFMSEELFLLVSSVAALGLIGLWVVAAIYVGRKHKEALDTDSVVC